MPKIKHLPLSLVSQIAAGEVIERPAYVVKELVENAVDASATTIDIHIQAGGLQKITVIDNGEGMDEEDVVLSIQKNTTSKLVDAEQLTHIQSLGFRGEALHSIASVSTLTIASRSLASTHGTQLQLSPSDDLRISPIGMPVGTRVVVEELFAHTPARRKFMRSPAQEFAQIMAVIQGQAIAHPKIALRLYHNSKLIFSLPTHATLVQRVHAFLAPEILAAMIPVQFTSDFFSLEGLIAKPQLAKTRRTHHYLVVNGRPIQALSIHRLIKKTYHSLLEPKAHPPYVLHLSLPPELTDVNIHPRKEEIRFMDDTYVARLIQKALATALESHDLTFTSAAGTAPLYSATRHLNRSHLYDTKTIPSTHLLLKESTPAWSTITANELPIFQAHHQYLFTPTTEGVAIIDQHAAHERILYEQFVQSFKEKKAGQVSTFSHPLVLTLAPAQVEVLQEQLPALSKIGLEITRTGVDRLELVQVPTILKDHPLHALMEEIADDLSLYGSPAAIDQKSNQVISYLACRSAIKAGDSLSLDQQQQLLEKLAHTTSAYTCPHGRPVRIIISLGELDKMFKRR